MKEKRLQDAVEAMAAMPGNVSVACNIDRMAVSSNKLTASEIDEITPKII